MTIRCPNFTTSRFVTISIFMKKDSFFFRLHSPLEFVSLPKKNDSALLLLLIGMTKIDLIVLVLGASTLKGFRASPPCRVKGTWQALSRSLGEKPAPPLSNHAALLARALQTSSSTHYPRGWALLLLRPHFGTSSTCDSTTCATFENQEHLQSLQGIFLTIFRVEEPTCK